MAGEYAKWLDEMLQPAKPMAQQDMEATLRDLGTLQKIYAHQHRQADRSGTMAKAVDWSDVEAMRVGAKRSRTVLREIERKVGRMAPMVAKALEDMGFDPETDPSRQHINQGGHLAADITPAQEIGYARALLRDAISRGELSAEQAAKAEAVINAHERDVMNVMGETMGKSMFGAGLQSLKLEVDISAATQVLNDAARNGAPALEIAKMQARLHNLAVTGRFNWAPA
jgi:hypothetical protein